jgi:hypothetical protein
MLFIGVIQKLQAAALGLLASFTVASGPAEEPFSANLATAPEPVLSGKWVDATVASCENTCDNANLRAVVAGVYVNGEKFFVCATNYNNEGFRPGYNLRPSSANACVVGWGGQEVNGVPYVCLCE